MVDSDSLSHIVKNNHPKKARASPFALLQQEHSKPANTHAVRGGGAVARARLLARSRALTCGTGN